MNARGILKQASRMLPAVFPAWSRAREQARYEATQYKYLAAAYEVAESRNSSRTRSSTFRNEDGQISELNLDIIRETSCESWRNNSLYSSFMRRGADNIIGTGMTVNPRTSDQNLNDELRLGFAEYTKKGGAWDATRQHSLGEMQYIALLSIWREGDFLAYRSDYGWQHFQGGQMGTPRGYSSNRRIFGGVEKNLLDRPDRYWVSNVSKYGYLDSATAKGLAAENCLHVGNFEWLNQSRGIPIYANCLDKFDDFFRYLEAELLGTMAAACTVLEINSPHANALAALGLGKKTDLNDKERLKNIRVAPAQVVHTYTGEKLNALKFDRPGNAFPEYLRSNSRLLGIPIGLPLEIALMDFSQTNFAAAKMAVVQAALTFLRWRTGMDMSYVGPIYQDWVRNDSGIIIPKEVKNPYAYESVPPKSDWLDPYKEALALNEGIRGGWETITNGLKEQMNRELVDVVREQAEELLTYERIAKEKKIDVKALLNYVKGQAGGEGGEKLIAEAVAEAVVARINQ